MKLEALINLRCVRSCNYVSEQTETGKGRTSNRLVAGSIPAGCAMLEEAA